jgi:hypothetical protein
MKSDGMRLIRTHGIWRFVISIDTNRAGVSGQITLVFKITPAKTCPQIVQIFAQQEGGETFQNPRSSMQSAV